MNELCGQDCLCGENWEHSHIILSRDPVTPEEDHMLGRMTTLKRLWSSPSRKPLATTFPRRGSWQGSGAESRRCVLISECDYMMKCHLQHLWLGASLKLCFNYTDPCWVRFVYSHLNGQCSHFSLLFFSRKSLTFKVFYFFLLTSVICDILI